MQDVTRISVSFHALTGYDIMVQLLLTVIFMIGVAEDRFGDYLCVLLGNNKFDRPNTKISKSNFSKREDMLWSCDQRP